MWYVEIHTWTGAWPSRSHLHIKAYSTWIGKSWMPKVFKFTKAIQDTGMVTGQELAGEDRFF